MTVRRITLAVLGLFLVGPVLWAAIRHVQREEASVRLMLDCAEAHRHVDFTGEAVKTEGDRTTVVTIRHDAESGRTSYTWRRGRSFTLSSPSSRMTDPTAWCMEPNALRRNYRVRDAGPASHLDRPGRLLVIEPRYEGRPTLNVIVDGETRLPLKVTSFKPDGEVYREIAFRSLKIGPQEVRKSKRRSKSWYLGTSVPLRRASESAGYRVLVPDYLPPGFELVNCRVNSRWFGKVRMKFTDGATAFELSQSIVPTPAQVETRLEKRMGRERAQGMMRRYRDSRLRRIAQAEDSNGEVVVRHCQRTTHRTFELRVDELEVKFVARGDFDREECLKVLRSLRRQ